MCTVPLGDPIRSCYPLPVDYSSFADVLLKVGPALAGGLYTLAVIIATLKVIAPLAACHECQRRLAEK